MSTEYLNNKTFEVMICKFQGSKRNKARYELILEDLKDKRKRNMKI